MHKFMQIKVKSLYIFISNRKICEFSDFNRSTVAGARQAGLSTSEIADLLGFSQTTVTGVYEEWRKKITCHDNYRGQRIMTRLAEVDRTASGSQKTAPYSSGWTKSMSEGI